MTQLPQLPPDAAQFSWAALVFFVASVLALIAIIAIAFRARRTLHGMIQEANAGVVEGLSRVERSVDAMTDEVEELNKRDAVVAEALKTMNASISGIEKRVERLAEKVSHLEGRFDAH